MRWPTWFKKDKDKKQNPPKKTKEDLVTCGNCGHVGHDSEFMAEDPDDSICPKCGEKDNLIYEM